MDGVTASLRFSPRASSTRKTRAAGIALAVLFHVLLLLAIFYGGWQTAPETQTKDVEVALLDSPAHGDISPKIVPHFVQSQAVVIPAPEITIAPDPSPITVMVQPSPPSKGEANTDGAGGNGQSDYIARLHRHLQGFMHTIGPQGSVTVRFFINSDGKLTSVAVVKSSGNRVLDAEALALMRRAQPLPPIPDEFKISSFGAVVPLVWSSKTEKK